MVKSRYFVARTLLQAAQAKLRKEAEEEAARIKKEEQLVRMPRHQDLELEVLAEDFDEEEMKTWKTLQSTLVAKKYQRRVGSWGELQGETKLERAKDDLVTELKKLTIVSRAKVCKVWFIWQLYQVSLLTVSFYLGADLRGRVPSYHCK
jgi:hypothetical protein